MEAELDGIGFCRRRSDPRGHVHFFNELDDANRAKNLVIAIAKNIHTEKIGLDNFLETRLKYLFQDRSN
ncbi:hypothetical protein [Flavobacterium lacus]|uniref:hypothetical protein n=1 Tax=Flavobacterium lacus TaxID=1353778 RepID=UPI0011BFAFF5|nr:hypothetical protein [Flavobacterium lacus]